MATPKQATSTRAGSSSKSPKASDKKNAIGIDLGKNLIKISRLSLDLKSINTLQMGTF